MRDQFLLLSTKANYEGKYMLFCKRTFSEVLESVTTNNFSGESHQTPIFQLNINEKRLFWHIAFHPLLEICNKYRLPASTWASTFLLPQSSSVVYVPGLSNQIKSAKAFNVAPEGLLNKQKPSDTFIAYTSWHLQCLFHQFFTVV